MTDMVGKTSNVNPDERIGPYMRGMGDIPDSEFLRALEDICTRILSGDAARETPLPQPQETSDDE
jgi:hypothetical protein